MQTAEPHVCRCGRCADPGYYPDFPPDAPLTQYVGIPNDLRKPPNRSRYYYAKITVNGIETWHKDSPYWVVEAYRGKWAIMTRRENHRTHMMCRTCGGHTCYEVITGSVEIAL